MRLAYVKAVLLLACLFPGLLAVGAGIFQISDPVEFSKIIDTNAVLTTNATINTWLEGPSWIPSGGGYLVFCDQDNNKLRKLVPPNTVTDFLVPPANTLFNGSMLDAQERLIGAEAGGGGLKIAMVTNGVIVPLVTTCNGLKFYSPNDVAIKSDGTIWFTDPGYNGGVGQPPQPGFQPGYQVYQFNPTNGNATCKAVITNGISRPNGLCFSPDETKLYVADSISSEHCIHVYAVSPSNTVSGDTVFAVIPNGVPDGIHCDAVGHVWSSGGDAIYIFAPADGHLIGKIQFHRTVNFCWGGPQYQTLYIVGQPLVTSIPVLVAGLPSLKRMQSTVKGKQLNLSWPAPSTGFALQEGGAVNPAGVWSNSTLTVTVSNAQNVVTVSATNPAKFYRLRLN